jgi:hypothetical protein
MQEAVETASRLCRNVERKERKGRGAADQSPGARSLWFAKDSPLEGDGFEPSGDEMADAHRYLEQSGQFGKIVVTV